MPMLNMCRKNDKILNNTMSDLKKENERKIKKGWINLQLFFQLDANQALVLCPKKFTSETHCPLC
jgi:hypothetical protein